MDPSGIQNQERRGPSSEAEPYVVNPENDPFSALAFKVIHERGRGPLVVSLTSLNWIRCVVNVLSGIYIYISVRFRCRREIVDYFHFLDCVLLFAMWWRVVAGERGSHHAICPP